MTRKHRRPSDPTAPRAGDRYESDDPDGERAQVQRSKRLALYLRRRPDKIGIELDGDGWASVELVLAGLARGGLPMTESDLRELVLVSDGRFSISDDGERIRAHGD